MNNRLRDVIDQALPEGAIPFTVEGRQIVAAGRRARRRRQGAVAGGVGAGVAMVATVVVLAPAALVSSGTSLARTADEDGEEWTLDDKWLAVHNDPFVDDETGRASRALQTAFGDLHPDATVYGDGDGGTVEFGRYTETSPDGDSDRELMRATGWVDEGNETMATQFELSIYRADSGMTADDFLDCAAAEAACDHRSSGNGATAVLATLPAGSQGRRFEQYTVCVYYTDGTLLEFDAFPADQLPAQEVLEPALTDNELWQLALAMPPDLEALPAGHPVTARHRRWPPPIDPR